jgi:hypothetical protein
VARIHGLESENVAKKCAVRFGVFTVDNYVGPEIICPPKKSPYLFARPLCEVTKLLRQPNKTHSL